MIDFGVITGKVAIEFLLRWVHILAGIVWIGLLYWFNLVNVNFQKALDPELKPKVNPNLILPTLFYFRWGAVVTVLSGFLYYKIILLGEPDSGMGKPLIAWLIIVGITYFILFNLIRAEGALNNGKLLAALVTALVVVMAVVIYSLFQNMGVKNNASYAIGFGGGIGMLMFANVWSIIWPNQKKILGVIQLKEGEDKVKLARRVFLASRTNAWLSIPMIFFMGVSSHLPLISFR